MPVLCRVSVRDWRLPPCAVQGNVAEKAGERVCRNGSVGAGDPSGKKEENSGSTPSNYEPGQYSLKQQLFSRENFRTKMLACFRGNDPDKGEGPESDQPWNAIAVSKLCGMVNWQQALNELLIYIMHCTPTHDSFATYIAHNLPLAMSRRSTVPADRGCQTARGDFLIVNAKQVRV